MNESDNNYVNPDPIKLAALEQAVEYHRARDNNMLDVDMSSKVVVKMAGYFEVYLRQGPQTTTIPGPATVPLQGTPPSVDATPMNPND